MWKRILCRVFGGHAWSKHQTVLWAGIAHFEGEVEWCPWCRTVKSVEIIWPLRTDEALARLSEVDVSFRLNRKGRAIADPPKGT